jgi:hypothetical protein
MITRHAPAAQRRGRIRVVAERSQYWPDPSPNWYKAHNGFGITAAGTKWGLAEGRVGQTPAYQTFILFANPGQTAPAAMCRSWSTRTSAP